MSGLTLVWAIRGAPDTRAVPRLALLGIADSARDDGHFFTSPADLANWTRQDAPTVNAALAELADTAVIYLPAGVAEVGDTEGFLCLPGWQDTVGEFLVFQHPRRHIPAAVRRTVMERDESRCVYCGSTASLTIDHVIPRVWGGTDDVFNLQVTCWSCNTAKGTKTDAEFRRRNGLTPSAAVR